MLEDNNSSTKTIIILFADGSQLEVAVLHSHALQHHCALGLFLIRKQNHRLTCLAFPQKSQLNTAPYKIESFEYLLNVPVIQRIRKASDFNSCLVEQTAYLNAPIVASGARVRWRLAGGAALFFLLLVTLKGISKVPRLFSLSFFSELVAIKLFLVDLKNFDIASAYEHAVFAEYHLSELSGYLNNCLPRKFPMLKYQT